jgi:hypothetical protein
MTTVINAEIRSFAIEAPQFDLNDLHAWLDRTGWTDELRGAVWKADVSPAHVKELAKYWRSGIDKNGECR